MKCQYEPLACGPRSVRFFRGGKVGVAGDEGSDRGMEVGLRYLHVPRRHGDVIEYRLFVVSTSS